LTLGIVASAATTPNLKLNHDRIGRRVSLAKTTFLVLMTGAVPNATTSIMLVVFSAIAATPLAASDSPIIETPIM